MVKLVILDGRAINTKDELHTYLARELGFPEWYGKNLDALHDCLTDVMEDVHIHILSPNELRDHLGRYCGGLLRVLSDVCEEKSNITVTEQLNFRIPNDEED